MSRDVSFSSFHVIIKMIAKSDFGDLHAPLYKNDKTHTKQA